LIDYIKYRLGKVTTKNNSVFTSGAIKNIVREAKGIPRIINILCDNALVTGFGYRKKPVTSRIVREVIADLKGKKFRVMPNAILVKMVEAMGASPLQTLHLISRFDDPGATGPAYPEGTPYTIEISDESN
jgi:hypothetical protein